MEDLMLDKNVLIHTNISPPPPPSLLPFPPLLDVPQWLKSLRLHKYQYLFADLTYEEMLQMKENYLEEKVGILTRAPNLCVH